MTVRIVGKTLIFSLMLIMSAFNLSAKVINYPAPPGLKTSPDFTVLANNTPVWTRSENRV
jgi:hypothetical protein